MTARAHDLLLRAVSLATSEEELGDIRALACHYVHDLAAIETAIARRRRELQREQ